MFKKNIILKLHVILLQCVKFSLLDVSRFEFCFPTPLNVSIILAAIGQTYLFSQESSKTNTFRLSCSYYCLDQPMSFSFSVDGCVCCEKHPHLITLEEAVKFCERSPYESTSQRSSLLTDDSHTEVSC